MARLFTSNRTLPRWLIGLIAAAFFGLGLLLVLRHELWQDEWQAWLLARDSASLTELLRNLRYEGHPALWHLGLFTLSRFTGNPLAMQLLHLLLASATVFIFLRCAPFAPGQTILFAFGYFPFFEFCAISRNYAAGVLLIFLFCAVFPRRGRGRLLALSAILFLLAQTSVYGLFLAGALGVLLVAAGRMDGDTLPAPLRPEIWVGAALLAGGFLLSILQLVPPPDSGFAAGWKLEADPPHLLQTVGTIFNSYLPFPAMQYHFWGTNILLNPYLKFCLALLLLAYPVILFRRQPPLLAAFSLGTLAILAFTYTKYPGSLRHHGHLFILLLACLWLSAYFPVKEGGRTVIARLSDFCRKNKDRWLTTLLTVQLAAGLFAAAMDLIYPFSAGQAAARYIREQHLDHLLLAGHEDDAASVVGGCLRRRIYYLASDSWGSFVVWNRRRKSLNDKEIVTKTRQLAAGSRRDILLIVNRDLGSQGRSLTKLRQFTGGIVPAENYHLYLARYDGGREER